MQEQLLPQVQASVVGPMDNLSESLHTQMARQLERLNAVERTHKEMQNEQEQIMEELAKYQDNLENLIQKSELDAQRLFKT